MILIGLTGGIASGKSTVSAMLQKDYHIHVIDADVIVRQLQEPGMSCTRQIAKRWPQCLDAESGILDRTALGNVVFEDPSARRALGRIMDGPIFRHILREIIREWWRNLSRRETVVVLDAPTLFGTNIFTYLISSACVVACSESTQVQRLQSRNQMNSTLALQRIRAQMPLEKKRQLAGHVIDNDGASMDELRRKVSDSVEWMRKQSDVKLHWLFGGAAAVTTAAVVLLALRIGC